MLKNIFYTSGIVAFLLFSVFLFKSFQENQIGTISPTPGPNPSDIPSITSQPPEISCTSDNNCPTGYACRWLQKRGDVIISGICAAKENGSCQTKDDCMGGLVCHTVPGIFPQKKCVYPWLGKDCTGTTDRTSCPSGYKCVSICGPIHGGIKDDSPKHPTGYSCMADEADRNCPICLASNTNISTPNGEIDVKKLREGMTVWSIDVQGKKVLSKIIKTANTHVPNNHKVIHLVLSDGREVWISPNHPTVNQQQARELRVGDTYDGATVRRLDFIPYWDSKTYDFLPDSDTGFYWANGILMASTLK